MKVFSGETGGAKSRRCAQLSVGKNHAEAADDINTVSIERETEANAKGFMTRRADVPHEGL